MEPGLKLMFKIRDIEYSFCMNTGFYFDFQACLMLSLESEYAPAHQLALDMLKVRTARIHLA